ncbi:hypothetical protein GOV13_00820 [Candidatus Pacearchaeota archaeon]|nr:hypothetical protein [Candidatus Pacearchaeota archaeon]
MAQQVQPTAPLVAPAAATPVQPVATPAASPPTSPLEGKPFYKRWWFWLIVAVVIIAVGYGMYSLFSG